MSVGGDRPPPADKGTFFRVYFAKPGTIEKVEVAAMEPAPDVSQILLKTGDQVRQNSREVFLGQMLWTFNMAQREDVLPGLIKDSASAIAIGYGDPG